MIDQATVNRIIDTADIVDVVSDFVSLKRRGANWVGLCPFHNDRTPSFYVSRSKGICKCFACGEGGSAVNFIMKHEQISYVEALRYLARKYHIEIQERELTDEEKMAQNKREALNILNEWACQFFEKQLHETTAGQEIGLSYFKDRGFTDEIIKRFRLGYSPEDRHALYNAALRAGHSRELLFELGLCKDDGHGGGYDFYCGRVMFPIFNVAGTVIAFGGRTLKSTDRAKYFNSPESLVYDKSKSTMYGLYQAKRAITRENKCFIVEGYADVISMHQAGFENVIASSGTALTDGHIHLLNRFTQNVTELFDGDAAGVKAALRGVDMLLKAGMNVRVLLLPEGKDPDNFAQENSSTEMIDYIKANESDFITFKAQVLLSGAENDPIKRGQAITDVVKSIALIPNDIQRMVYVKECSAKFGISESVLARDIARQRQVILDEDYKQRQRERAQREAQQQLDDIPPAGQDIPPHPADQREPDRRGIAESNDVQAQERYVAKYIAKYGMCYMSDDEYDDGQRRPITVLEYIANELLADSMEFTHPVYKAIFNQSMSYLDAFYNDLEQKRAQLESGISAQVNEQMEHLDVDGLSADDIQQREQEITARVNADVVKQIDEFRKNYLERILCSTADDAVRQTATELVSERYHLSKIHTANAVVVTEYDRLSTIVEEAIFLWKSALVNEHIADLKEEMKHCDPSETATLLQRLQEQYAIRSALARLTGERVVNPK